MKLVTKYPDNYLSWIDLNTTDVAGAKKFYGELFGWEAIDLPIDGGGFYTMFQLDGHDVAGMGEMDPAMAEQGVPVVWTTYVNHSDVDAVAEKVAAAGGTAVMPPMDVMESGRMAIFTDPAGGAFGVWQPNQHIGAKLVNHVNAWVWNEMQTKAPEPTGKFYSEVFGWAHGDDGNGYGMFMDGERALAGMIDMSQEEWFNFPNFWVPYFMVEDVAAATAKAESLGAKVHIANQSAGEMGAFSMLADPQGAMFYVMQFEGPVDEPPGP